jgi:NADH:quinone reductase (non-electrogenic)
MSAGNLPRAIIIGGGFGGLNAAQKLARLPVDVTVIDRKNHHTFQPLLYQVATAGLSPGEIAAPIRGVLKETDRMHVLLAEVAGFDLARKMIRLRDGSEFPYDYLIVAAGATHSYFGHEDWEPLAPGLKEMEDATEIRRRVLLAYELAERRAAVSGKAEPVHFVIVGGGPTGVELAGAIAEIARHTLARDFDWIDPRNSRILLIEGGPRVLPAYPDDLSRSAEHQLRKLGVEVMTNARVTSIEPGLVCVGEQAYPSTVTLWAAGVAASPLGKALGVPTDRAGHVLVNADLSVPGYPEVFVIGDLATLTDRKTGKPLPGLAPVAMQEGRHVAKVIGQDLRKAPREEFRYHDKGTLATIGRAAAVADLGEKLHFSGFPAWFLWLFVHLMYLVGFRNRLLVFIEWFWAYLTYDRSARLITGSTQLPGWPQQQKLHENIEPSVEQEHHQESRAAD